jgi:hypothetical protein
MVKSLKADGMLDTRSISARGRDKYGAIGQGADRGLVQRKYLNGEPVRREICRLFGLLSTRLLSNVVSFTLLCQGS